MVNLTQKKLWPIFWYEGGGGERNKLVLASVQLPYQASYVRSTEQKKIAKLEQKTCDPSF